MKHRQQLKKQPQTGQSLMTIENLKICIKNQQGYETFYLNDSLHLQYYNFVNIANLQQFVKPVANSQIGEQAKDSIQQIKGVNTLFLNNNLIGKIQNLAHLTRSLVTLNLSHNKIRKIQGLIDLVNLVVLDLSYNQIKQIQTIEIQPLKKLNRFNLAGNLFTSKQSIQAITILNKNLESLDLSSNNAFCPEADQILPEVFAKLDKMKILNLKQTPFVRMTSAYRKKVILMMESLVFLDDRPITQDERTLVKAWSQGGIKFQNQARKLIRQDKLQKNRKILGDIEQRQKIVNEKVQKLFRLLASKQLQQLEKLKDFVKTQDFSMLTTEQQSLIRLKIDELQRFLQFLRQRCRSSDLDKELELNEGSKLPKMLIEKRTSQCIYVYNVDQTLIQELKTKYYPQQTLPIKIVNYEKPKVIEWLSEYDDILLKTYNVCKGNWQIIVPAFNLEIYDFDEACGREVRRFKIDELKKKFENLKNENASQFMAPNQDRKYVHVISSAIKTNQLDCLD